MRKWVNIMVFLVIGGIIGYNYIYQDHRSIADETAEVAITSEAIATEFFKNTTKSEQKFLNKTIEVSGLISEINTNDITIDDKVFCQFSDVVQTALNTNSKVKIKGRVIGYDDLLEQVKLDQCTITNIE